MVEVSYYSHFTNWDSKRSVIFLKLQSFKWLYGNVFAKISLNSNLKRYMHANIHSSAIYNSQDMEATQGPMDRQMDKDGGIYVWGASLVAQMVKNLPAMQETQVQSLDQEDPLEKGMATSPGFLPGESHGLRKLAGYSPWSHNESDMTEWLTNMYGGILFSHEN